MTPPTRTAVRRTALTALAFVGTAAQALSIQPADIIDQFVPSLPFSQQPWGVVQCYGQFIGSAKLPETGLRGTVMPSGSTLRFGKAPDPADPTRVALRAAIVPSDPTTAGAPRCETTFSPGPTGLPLGKRFWHAFAIHIPDWRNTKDEQLLMQWNPGDGTGLQPIYALIVRGPRMSLVMRYSTSATPTRSNTVVREVWSSSSWPPNTWITIATQALISPDPAAGPMLRTWINGQPVVNYNGPLGYNTPTAQPYVKHGIYHYLEYNAWDLSLPERTVHFRRAVLVNDARGVYSATDLSAHVNLP